MRTLNENTMQRVVSYVDRYHEKNGYTPTIAEIAGALSLAVGTVHKYLTEWRTAGAFPLSVGTS